MHCDKYSHSHGHDHGHGERHFHGTSAHAHGGTGAMFFPVILLNVIITAAEYAGGVMSGSLALISDAGHNFSDVLSLLLGYGGEKVSRIEKSGRYTFGLKRFEVLTALINALTLVAIGMMIFYESVERFMHPVRVDLVIMIPVALVGLAGNLLSIFILHRGETESLNVKAASLHLLFDAVSSVAVIIAGVVIYFTGNYWVDIVISCFIGILIIWSAFGILRESLLIFLQGVPSHIETAQVYETIAGVPGVVSLHGLHIWSINSREVFLSCHICLDSDSSNRSDEIIGQINTGLDERFGINHSAIQVEFGDVCGVNGDKCCR